MAETKHSPGPWRLHVDGVSIFDARENRQQVVDCSVCSPNLSEDEQKANAKLIARAPSMAERLRLIERAALDRIDGDSQPNDTHWGEIIGIACGDPNWLQHAKANYPVKHQQLVKLSAELIERILHELDGELATPAQIVRTAEIVADLIEQDVLPEMFLAEDGRTFLRSQGQPYPREESQK